MAFQEQSKKNQARLSRKILKEVKVTPDYFTIDQQIKNVEAAFNQTLNEKQRVEDLVLTPLKMKLDSLNRESSRLRALRKEADKLARPLSEYLIDIIKESVTPEQWDEYVKEAKARKARGAFKKEEPKANEELD